MPDKGRMMAPFLRVLMDDGAYFEVQADNRDLLAYETHARKRGLPLNVNDPAFPQMAWCNYLAWHALKRESQITDDVTFEQFCDTAVNVDPSPVTVDPTNPGPGTG